ncbi:MAG: DUF6062 family protein [Lachnospiraceae bacterium]|nr:DUF6062 family protein [Lachnospiraceae bacterium]
MKEVLYTIPLNDALNLGGECPFCHIEKEIEQDLLDFVLGSGSSYMESDVREMTDKEGFCRPHFKKMYEYGNTLGNAWILKTHFKKINAEFREEVRRFSPGKRSLKDRLTGADTPGSHMSEWLNEKNNSCYICKRASETYDRYIATFFHMYRKETDFAERLKATKGFCLSHFRDIMAASYSELSGKEQEDFYPMMFKLMEENLLRLEEDVSWLVEKFDYRNKDADWKNSKDAVQRGMQKLKGGLYE